MTQPPPVSVVMPVFNGEPYLAEALASIQAQTFSDLEIVVQDDGSTDGTAAIVASAAAQDARIRLESAPNQGVAWAASRAADRAQGALIVRMDADDRMRPERVERLVELAAADPGAGYLGSRARFFPRENVGPGMAQYEAWHDGVLTHEAIHRDRFVEYPIPHPTTAVRREVWERFGPYRDGDFPEDYDFFLRCAVGGVRFAKHPDVLLDWREGAHRTTKHDGRYGLDRFHAIKVTHLVPLLRTQDRPVGIVGAGKDGKRWARSLVAEGLTPARFVDVHPGRIGQQIDGIPVTDYASIDPADRCFYLAAVGKSGARDGVRKALCERGLTEEADFLCVQ